MASVDPEIARTQEERKRMEQQLASLTSVTFDTDLYGGSDRDAYLTSIPANEDEENMDAMDNEVARKLASYTAPKSLLKEMPGAVDGDADIGFKKPQRIIDREDDYRQRRLNRIISPERHDPFAAGEKTPDPSVRTYADVMREEALKREKEETLRAIAKKKKEEEEAAKAAPEKSKESGAAVVSQKRRNRWDQAQDDGPAKKSKTSDWDLPDSTPGRWDATPTPGRVTDATPGRRNRWDETPTPGRLADSDATPAGGVTPGATPAGMTWDATPKLSGMATPTPKRQRSRWDETPATMGSVTPLPGATPAAAYTPGVTPVGAVELATPTPGAINLRGAITPEQKICQGEKSESVASFKQKSHGENRNSMQQISEQPEKKQKNHRRRSFMGFIRKGQSNDESLDNEVVEESSENEDDERPDSIDDKVTQKEKRKASLSLLSTAVKKYYGICFICSLCVIKREKHFPTKHIHDG